MAALDEEVEAELTDALTCISTGEKDVNDADEDGSTTLHLAAEVGHDEVVELLLNARADVHLMDADGASPLILACQGGHARCVKALLAARANPLADFNGSSALTEAQLSGSRECMALLVQAMHKSARLAAVAMPEMSTASVQMPAPLSDPAAPALPEPVPEPAPPPVPPPAAAPREPGSPGGRARRVWWRSSAPEDLQLRARMHSVRLGWLRRMQREPPRCVWVSTDAPQRTSAMWWRRGGRHSSALVQRACVPMRSAIVDVEALSGGWAAALSDAGRLFTIDTLGASTGPWSDSNEQPAADGDADDDDEDEGRRWLRASPSGALLLLAHVSRGVAEVWKLSVGSGRLRRQCVLPPVEGVRGSAARLEDACWVGEGRLLVCASVWCRLLDVSTGGVLLRCDQSSIVGVGVGRRIASVGATEDGDVAVTGSNHGHLICWLLRHDDDDDREGAIVGVDVSMVGGAPETSVPAARARHSQPHSRASFGPIARVQPIGAFARKEPADTVAGAREGWLVSMQTSDPAGECIETVRVWRELTAAAATATSTAGTASTGAPTVAWECLFSVSAEGLADVCVSSRLIVCSEPRGRVGVWGIDPPARVATLVPARAHQQQREALAEEEEDEEPAAEWCLQFSRDGALVAVDCASDTITLFDMQRYEQIWASEPGVDMVTLC